MIARLAATAGRTYQGMITGTPSAIQAMKFAAPGKETVYVAWTSTPAVGGSVTALKRCSASLNLAGVAQSTSSCVTDMRGNAINCTSEGLPNSRMICPVTPEGGPIFIRMSTQ